MTEEESREDPEVLASTCPVTPCPWYRSGLAHDVTVPQIAQCAVMLHQGAWQQWTQVATEYEVRFKLTLEILYARGMPQAFLPELDVQWSLFWMDYPLGPLHTSAHNHCSVQPPAPLRTAVPPRRAEAPGRQAEPPSMTGVAVPPRRARARGR